jgi:hypothetical protein
VPAGEFGGRTSYAITTGSEVLLVDPLVTANEPVVDVLDNLVRSRVRILVTMPYHTRSSESLWRRYGSKRAGIYGHSAVASRLEDVSGFQAMGAGDDVAGVARCQCDWQAAPRSPQLGFRGFGCPLESLKEPEPASRVGASGGHLAVT